MVCAPRCFGPFTKVQYAHRSRQRFVSGRKTLREYVTRRCGRAAAFISPAARITAVSSGPLARMSA